jgi:hydroxyethylthiazole kinase-like sugar kinase family protein
MTQLWHESSIKLLNSFREQKPLIGFMSKSATLANQLRAFSAFGGEAILVEHTIDLEILKKILVIIIDIQIADYTSQTKEELAFIARLTKMGIKIVVFAGGYSLTKNRSSFLKAIKEKNPTLVIYTQDDEELKSQKSTLSVIKSYLKRTKANICFTIGKNGKDNIDDRQGRNCDIISVKNTMSESLSYNLLFVFVSGAMVSVSNDIFLAAVCTSVLLRAAEKRALSVTNGPGSFYPVFLDALYHLKRDYIYQIQVDEHSVLLEQKAS